MRYWLTQDHCISTSLPLPGPPPRAVRWRTLTRVLRFTMLVGFLSLTTIFAAIGIHDATMRSGQRWPGALAGWLLAGGTIGFLDWRMRCERALARHGRATRGRVVDVQVVYGYRGPKGWRISYEFADARGETQTGRVLVIDNVLKAALAIGAGAIVLFDAGRPGRNCLLSALSYVEPQSLCK